MLHFTLIVRQSDSLALAADTDNGGPDRERQKVTAKNLLRKLSQGNTPPLMTVEASQHAYHVLSEGGVLFLTMCDASSPSAVAFAYLEDVAREFLQQYGQSLASATRPYVFIKFDLYLQKTKKVFASSTARGATAASKAGRPQPVKRSFREVMGYGDAGKGAVKGGGNQGDTTIIFIAVGVAVAVILVVFLILYFLL